MIIVLLSLYAVGPPQSVLVVVLNSASLLNVTWTQPSSGITNDPVIGYNVECATTRGSSNEDNIRYKTSGTVSSTSTSILIPINNHSPSIPSPVYNCCVEAEYETYSSIACALARLDF